MFKVCHPRAPLVVVVSISIVVDTALALLLFSVHHRVYNTPCGIQYTVKKGLSGTAIDRIACGMMFTVVQHNAILYNTAIL